MTGRGGGFLSEGFLHLYMYIKELHSTARPLGAGRSSYRIIK